MSLPQHSEVVETDLYQWFCDFHSQKSRDYIWREKGGEEKVGGGRREEGGDIVFGFLHDKMLVVWDCFHQFGKKCDIRDIPWPQTFLVKHC